MLATYTGTLPSQQGYEPTEGDIHAIAERLGKVESAELEMARVNEQEAIKPRSVSPSKRPVIAIYVALKMERLFLVKRWNLTGEYPDPVRRGRLGEVDDLLYGQDEMGRVSAAVATMQFLEKYPKPDMLLVTGIAGGFDREGSSRGDVLIPTSIADLASRKIHGGGHVIPEFRPREFRTDARLSRYVNSGSFKTRDWEGAVIEEAEWPEGLRPSIRNGPIASLDEVVSDTQWIDTLCKAWPKLCGVDMESGGVCAAAEAHELKVAVVRGVSDLADPAIVGRCLEAKSHENRRPPA